MLLNLAVTLETKQNKTPKNKEKLMKWKDVCVAVSVVFYLLFVD